MNRTITIPTSRSLHSQQCRGFRSIVNARYAYTNAPTSGKVFINDRRKKGQAMAFSAFTGTQPSSSSSTTTTSCLRRHFSTPSENSNNDGKETHESHEQQEVIFPWRENATIPHPRIGTKNDLSGFNKTPNSRFSLKLACAVELKEFTPWSFFISKKWEKNLAKNASWGFQTAVAGLVSRTFGVPLHLIENTLEDGLVLDYIVGTDENDDSGDGSDIKDCITKATGQGEDNTVSSTNNEDEFEDSTEFIQNMIESNLLALYKPIHNQATKDENETKSRIQTKYQITFCLKPISYHLESIFMIPSLTRQDVELNPSLKGAYMAIDKAWKEKASVEKIGEMSKELTRKTSHYGTKRSIIMDVAINCAEIFQIKDLSSGKIIQGQGMVEQNDSSSGVENQLNDLDLEPEMTTHLVRFEMVTSKGMRPGERKIGSWYVIDIDDMLEGNNWH